MLQTKSNKEKIKNYLTTTNIEKLDILNFLNTNPEFLLDVDTSHDFLFSEKDDQYKLKVLELIFEIKEIEVENRPKTKGVSFNPYETFLEMFSECKGHNKNVGLRLYKNVGKPTFLFCPFLFC